MERAVVTASDTLQARFDAGERFDQGCLLVLLRQVAAELADAHRRGKVHGTIRPGDIQFDVEGAAALEGFGRDTTPDPMTVTCYAPIEAYAPVHPLGPWTDIYSLGAVLWHATTGQPPADALHRKGGMTLAGLSPDGFDLRFLQAVDAAMEIAPQRRPQTIEAWLAMFPSAPTDTDETAVPATAVSVRRLPALYLTAAVALVAGSWAAMVLLAQPDDQRTRGPVAAVRTAEVAQSVAVPPPPTIAVDAIAAQRETVARHVAEGNRLLQQADAEAGELDRLRAGRSIEAQWRESVQAQRRLLDAQTALTQLSRQLAGTSDAGEAARLVTAAAAARADMETQRQKIAALVVSARRAPLVVKPTPQPRPATPEPARQQVAAQAPAAQPPIIQDIAPVDGGQPPRALIKRADRTLRDVFDEYEDLRRLIRRSYGDEDLAHATKRRAYRDTMRIYEELMAMREVRNRLVRTGNIRAANQRYDQLELAAARLRGQMEGVRRSI